MEWIKCETCSGTGYIDERLGGHYFNNPKAKCPDCNGDGEFEVKSDDDLPQPPEE